MKVVEFVKWTFQDVPPMHVALRVGAMLISAIAFIAILCVMGLPSVIIPLLILMFIGLAPLSYEWYTFNEYKKAEADLIIKKLSGK